MLARAVQDGEVSLKDAFWFSFISTTTVGFGDYYLNHDVFHIGDMFYVPVIFLLVRVAASPHPLADRALWFRGSLVPPTCLRTRQRTMGVCLFLPFAFCLLQLMAAHAARPYPHTPCLPCT